jgi:hypothetical protein
MLLPHLGQNLASGLQAWPQPGQGFKFSFWTDGATRACPHLMQNLAASLFSAEQ